MTIPIHLQFRSESEAYRAASDSLSAAYEGLATRSFSESIERETAIQVARLTHFRCSQEYLCEFRDEDPHDPTQVSASDGPLAPQKVRIAALGRRLGLMGEPPPEAT
jgi:hypothetical protein